MCCRQQCMQKGNEAMAQFTNQASISYNGLTANSNIVTGEIQQVLTASKTSVSQSYRSGELLTYAVGITNSGSADMTGLTVSDDLGAYTVGSTSATPLTYDGSSVLYYVNGVLQVSPTVTAGPPMTISTISIPAGGNALLVYRARVNDFASPAEGGSIVNTVTISGDGLTEPVTAAETVTADPAALLSITKSLSPTVVAENGQITYTFTIQNTGASAVEADAALIISDTFDPVLAAPLSVMLNGDALTQTGNYTYDASTGAFATVAGRVTVPAATYAQAPTTGRYTVTPGVTTMTITGRI